MLAWFITFGLLLPTYALAQSPRIQCFVPGECLDSQILDTVITNSSRTCLHHCQKIQGCEWFTFYADSKICTSLSGCLDLSPKKCPGNCISGENECPEFQCGLQGRCFGALEGIRKVGSARECGTICSNRLECLWHTYNPSQASCTLTNDCPALDKSCSDCVVSETQCEAQEDGQTTALEDGAVIPPSYALLSIGKSPYIVNLVDLKPVVCQDTPSPDFGGQSERMTMRMNNILYQMSVSDNRLLRMAHFDVEQRKWTSDRSFEFGGYNISRGFTRLGDGSLFFPNENMDFSFYVDEKGPHEGPKVETFAPGTQFKDFCFTTVTGNDVFLSGGRSTAAGGSGTSHTNASRHINPKTKAVVSLPDMPQALLSHVCSTYSTEEGPKVLILGGVPKGTWIKNKKYYLFDWTTKTYTEGDETKFTMPAYMNLYTSIPFGDTVLVSLTTMRSWQSLQFYKFDPRNPESVLQLRGEYNLSEEYNTNRPPIVMSNIEDLPCR